ncbi:RHS repeat domain-containing protein, partial [Xanthomonas campestris]|uniref:RHS repeat domain-containing protein n=1 Tax=Xanthomonas campestris TaxID=339 RepID=UPI00209D18AA
LGTTNTYTLYDEAGHWLGDYDTKQQAIWLDDLPVGLLANGGQLHYIEPDHLGSPRVAVDAARDVAVWNWSLKGEAFGNTAPNQDPDGDGTAMVFDMRFPGQRFDAASGFNQNYFRDYDAATGRYGQSDPIGLRGGISSYLYSLGTPIRLYDPSGLEAVWDTKTCAGQLGLTTCDGKGGFMVSNCNFGCDRECTQRHEEEHQRFLKALHPGACLGRPLGAAPWPQNYAADSEAYAREFHETECRADAITIDCISNIKKKVPLDVNAKRNLLEAFKRRESRKCEDYGF